MRVTSFSKINHVLCFEFVECVGSRISAKVSLHLSQCHSFASSWWVVGVGMNVCLAVGGLNVGFQV